jgi:hypothetical protein
MTKLTIVSGLLAASFLHPQAVHERKMTSEFRVVAFADRWSDFGARGNVPSVRDFLASKKGQAKLVKLRVHYWPQEADPLNGIGLKASTISLHVTRSKFCDESVASLKGNGEIDPSDPELRRPRLKVLQGAERTKVPSEKTTLACYEGNWPPKKV